MTLAIERGDTRVNQDDIARTFNDFIRSYDTTAPEDSRHVEKMNLLRRLQHLVFDTAVGFNEGDLRPFAYDKAKAEKHGFLELNIEAHEKAQAIVDAVYARDPRYVTLHHTAGSPDPATITADKYTLNADALEAAWKQDCPDLPNVPEKSMWYFRALAEHRLSNRIDGDYAHNITNPSVPHIPGFGQ